MSSTLKRKHLSGSERSRIPTVYINSDNESKRLRLNDGQCLRRLPLDSQTSPEAKQVTSSRTTRVRTMSLETDSSGHSQADQPTRDSNKIYLKLKSGAGTRAPTENLDPKTLRSGRTWLPTFEDDIEIGRGISHSRELNAVKSIEIVDKKLERQESVAVGLKFRKLNPNTPTSTIKKLEKSSKVETQVIPPKPVPSSRSRAGSITLGKNSLRGPVLERIREDRRKEAREARTRQISTHLSDALIQLGNFSRSVGSLTIQLFEWDQDFWSQPLKLASKVLILSPESNLKTNVSRPAKIIKRVVGTSGWPVKLEVDALELRLLQSGGDPPLRSDEWKDDYLEEKVSIVFIHRTYIENFINWVQPSILKMLNQKPRVQFMVFGHTPSQPTLTMTKLIFKAGAILMPTIKSLNEKINKSEKLSNLQKLRQAQTINPFIRVFLPKLSEPVKVSELSNLSIEESIEFLESFETQDSSDQDINLVEFVSSSRNGPKVLPKRFSEEDDKEEEEEIIKALKEIRKTSYHDFRRFVILVDSQSLLLKKKDQTHNFIKGIEVMSIKQACDSLENGFL